MSSETIEVKRRDALGSRAAARLREKGYVPANLYGHGQENAHLSVRSDSIQKIISQGAKMLSLKGDVTDTALLSEVQWDAFGMDVLHVDLIRVSKREAVEVTVGIELQGAAPGETEGGMLTQNVHELSIQCPANVIPDQITINISSLHIGDSIVASQIELPPGASLVTPETEVIIQVSEPATEAEEAVEGEAAAEPEVIGESSEEE